MQALSSALEQGLMLRAASLRLRHAVSRLRPEAGFRLDIQGQGPVRPARSNWVAAI